MQGKVIISLMNLPISLLTLLLLRGVTSIFLEGPPITYRYRSPDNTSEHYQGCSNPCQGDELSPYLCFDTEYVAACVYQAVHDKDNGVGDARRDEKGEHCDLEKGMRD